MTYIVQKKDGERCKNCGWWLSHGIHHQYGNGLWSCDGHMPHCRPDCTTKHK